jgi:peptidoglycan-associated lipoprotein
LASLAGCPKNKNTRVVDTGTSDRSDSGRDRGDRDGDDGSTTKGSADDGTSVPSFAAVYFEFDSTNLTADARGELQQLADWLESHPKAKITIEGHCDDRGTDEYNIALGQTRATIIQDYLSRLGVDQGRLATISYGEERPAANGEDEEVWALNRRGELVPDR